jgi:peroxidase
VIGRNPDDVDIFAGGMLEPVVPAGTVGPTFACIIARQFRNLRVGDRYWYERPDSVTGFTKGNGH